MGRGGGRSDGQVSCHPGGGGLETWKWAGEVGCWTSRSVATQVDVSWRHGNAQVLDIQVSCHPGGGGLETGEMVGRTARSVAI